MKSRTAIRKKGILLVVLLAVLAAGCADKGFTVRKDTIEGRFEILWDFGMGLSPTGHMIQHLQAAYPETEFYYEYISRITYPIDDARMFGYNQIRVMLDNRPADLVVFEHILAPDYIDSGYLEPLDDYVAADPSIRERLDPKLLEHLREQGNGSIYAIPFAKNVYALYYNKDIFDELQIPHPRDGMTWDDVLALARQISDRSPKGDRQTTIGPLPNFQVLTERSAFGLPDRHLALSQMGGRFPDPDAGPPDFRDPVWERYERFLADLASVKAPTLFYAYKDFAAGNLAMAAGRLHGSPLYSSVGDEATDVLTAPFAEWDLVSFPVFADAPDTGPAPAYYYIGIPKNSLRKQEAFRLISHMLSDEVQLENSKNGLASVRGEPAFRDVFGERTYKALGKNVEAFFYHPKEADLGPGYSIHLQYQFYQTGISSFLDQDPERYRAARRDEYLRLEEYRKKWLAKAAMPD